MHEPRVDGREKPRRDVRLLGPRRHPRIDGLVVNLHSTRRRPSSHGQFGSDRDVADTGQISTALEETFPERQARLLALIGRAFHRDGGRQNIIGYLRVGTAEHVAVGARKLYGDRHQEKSDDDLADDEFAQFPLGLAGRSGTRASLLDAADHVRLRGQQRGRQAGHLRGDQRQHHDAA